MRDLRRTFLLMGWLAVFAGWSVLQGCACDGVTAPGVKPPGDPKHDLEKGTKPKCLKVTPVNFSGIPLRCTDSLEQEVEIQHMGHAHCPKVIQLQGAALSAGGVSGGFELMQPPAFPYALEAGKSVRMTLGFRAKALGQAKASLVLNTTAPEQETLDVPVTGLGVHDQSKADTFKQESQASDILFVIDNSCSMREEQSNLANNFASFIQWAQKLNADYQIGVITTETKGSFEGCLRGEKKILRASTPELLKHFANNVQVGTHGNYREKGLDAAFRALQPPKVNACNKGFLRSNAVLSLIFISDEPDQSEWDVDFYVGVFLELKGKGREHMVRASAVVGPEKDGCRSIHGSALAGPRYLELARKLGGVTASICEQNWSNNLKAIGLASVISRFNFPLSKPAEDKSVLVFVNGTLVPRDDKDGWQYDPKSNRVTFQGSHIPTPGAKIEVKYLVRCPEPAKTP